MDEREVHVPEQGRPAFRQLAQPRPDVEKKYADQDAHAEEKPHLPDEAPGTWERIEERGGHG